MKKTNTFTNIAMFVLFAAMLVYLGVYLFRSTQQSYATAPAVLVTVSEGGQCKPPVRRDGTPLWSSPRGAGRPIPVTG